VVRGPIKVRGGLPEGLREQAKKLQTALLERRNERNWWFFSGSLSSTP